jgi:hypothetical protein
VTGIGPGNSLAAKVEAAMGSLQQGWTTGACDSLQALINEANAQSGKSLTAEQAAMIVSMAMSNRTTLGC